MDGASQPLQRSIAPPTELIETLAGLLTSKDFRAGDSVPLASAEQVAAYIIREGEITIEIEGEQADIAVPGTLVRALGAGASQPSHAQRADRCTMLRVKKARCG